LESKWLRRVAIVVIAAFLLGTLFVNVTALRVGAPWVGQNYWHQPIDTYGQFIVLVFVMGFGIYWLFRNRNWWL
jgi:hypothetical protein